MALVHELTHALRGEAGLKKTDTDGGVNQDEEAHAIQVENQIRNELGYGLRGDGDQRDDINGDGIPDGDGTYGTYNDITEAENWYAPVLDASSYPAPSEGEQPEGDYPEEPYGFEEDMGNGVEEDTDNSNPGEDGQNGEIALDSASDAAPMESGNLYDYYWTDCVSTVDCGHWANKKVYVQSGYYNDWDETVKSGYWTTSTVYVSSGYYNDYWKWINSGYYYDHWQWVNSGYYALGSYWRDCGYWDRRWYWADCGSWATGYRWTDCGHWATGRYWSSPSWWDWWDCWNYYTYWSDCSHWQAYSYWRDCGHWQSYNYWVDCGRWASYTYWKDTSHYEFRHDWIDTSHWQFYHEWKDTSHYETRSYWVDTSHKVHHHDWVDTSHYDNYSYWADCTTTKDCHTWHPDPTPSLASITENFFLGLADSVADTAKGIWNMITHPIKTAEGVLFLAKAATPGTQENALLTSIVAQAVSKVYTDFTEGDYNKRSRMIGQLVGQVVLAVIGTKGTTAATEALEASLKSGKLATMLGDIGRGTRTADEVASTLETAAEGVEAGATETEVAEFMEAEYNEFTEATQSEISAEDAIAKTETKFTRTQEELDDLAKDPDHNFEISKKTMAEREAALKVEAKGEIAGPITRNKVPGPGEYIDAHGGKWDVKGWYSKFKPTGYNLQDAIGKIGENINKGINIIVDTTKMDAADINELYQEVVRRGWTSKVKWDVNPF